MLRRIFAFLIASFIVMSLIAIHTSITNLLWLSSINMPVTLDVATSMVGSDLLGMSFEGVVPVSAIILVGLLIAFLTAFILSRWLSLSQPRLYALAGGSALLALVLLLQLLGAPNFIAGARTIGGKIYIILFGILAGYYFGSQLEKV